MFDKIHNMQVFYECQGVRVKTIKLTWEQIEQLIDELTFVPYTDGKLQVLGIKIQLVH